MTISRGQMNRQLYMGGGIMGAVPRENFFLGKAVKAVTKPFKKAAKTVSKIASSDLGKAALLATGAYGLGGGTFFGKTLPGIGTTSGFKLGNIPLNLFGQSVAGGAKPGAQFEGILSKIGLSGGYGGGLKMPGGNIGKLATLGAVSTFLTQELGMTEEQAEEALASDTAGYLERYYRNLNPNASEEEVTSFVAANTSEYAVGGRVGFDNGSPKINLDDVLKDFFDKGNIDPDMIVPEPEQSPDATPIPEGMMINPLQTMEFRDSNNNGIEDRDEGIYLEKDFIPKKDPEEFELEKFRKYFEDTKEFRKVPRKNQAKGTGDPQEGEIFEDSGLEFPVIDSVKPSVGKQARSGSILTLMDGTEVFIPTGAYSGGTLADIIYSSTKGDLLREDILGMMLFSKGGRVGFANGDEVIKEEGLLKLKTMPEFKGNNVKPADMMMASDDTNQRVLEALFEKYLDMGLSPKDAAEAAQKEFERMSKRKMESTRGLAALGGRMNYALGDSASENAMQAASVEGLPIRQNPKGIRELDLRDNGGFIPPVGIKEKADDIPAMLSNNEFVFTADAVRGMGDGDVNLGAQRMYDQMKMLEAGGKV